MSFVPVTTIVPPQPSARARELGRKIAVVIEEFRREDPGTTAIDVQQALQLARENAGANRVVPMVVVGVILLVVLGILAFVLMLGSS
jgi:hypothetical protein